MKIKFIDDSVTEYKNGSFHAVNNGEPIDVDPNIAPDILAAKHSVAGDMVPIFEPVVDADEVAEPETAESLAKKHSRGELEKMAKKAGLDGNDYTNKTELATAILNSAKGE